MESDLATFQAIPTKTNFDVVAWVLTQQKEHHVYFIKQYPTWIHDIEKLGIYFFGSYSIVVIILNDVFLRRGKEVGGEASCTWFCNERDGRADGSVPVRIFGLDFKIIPEIGRKHILKEKLV